MEARKRLLRTVPASYYCASTQAPGRRSRSSKLARPQIAFSLQGIYLSCQNVLVRLVVHADASYILPLAIAPRTITVRMHAYDFPYPHPRPDCPFEEGQGHAPAESRPVFSGQPATYERETRPKKGRFEP